MQSKYYINTYGCQMNVHESEKLAGIFREHGYVEAKSQEEADFIVFNTCCIRETAEQRVLGNLGIVKKMLESRPHVKVAVCGCMVQKDGSAQMLKKRCPFINLIFGTHNLHKFGEYLDRLQNEKFVKEIWEKEDGVAENVPIYRTSGVNAWLNIMYGCNNFCSYCIVPYVRGRERSRKSSIIIDDIKKLVDEGYKEITLLGQNVNSYGNDCDELSFANLLGKISEIDGRFKVRFMTSHPKDLSEDVVRVISQSDKLADYIHLPIQSGSDKILKLMNRRYTKRDYLNRIDMIRKYIPNVGLSSDVMVGFPYETEEDFLETVDVVKRVEYNNLFTFIYSRRSGTPADKMDQIDIAVKKERISKLIDLQFEIGNKTALDCVGQKYEVLCDSWQNGKGKGKSSCEKAIEFKCECDVTGVFLPVKITGTKNNQLKGEIIR